MSTSETMGSLQTDSSASGPRPYRHSIDLNAAYVDNTVDSTPTSSMSPSTTQGLSTPPKLQSSFSSNDIPTVKNMSGAGMPSANAHAQQHFHNHNASIGRIPPGAVKRHSRELSGDNHAVTSQPGGTFPSIQSQLQANAPSFGPIASSQAPVQSPVSAGNINNSATSPSVAPVGSFQYHPSYGQNPPNGAYNMGMLTMGMQNMNMNGMNGMNGYPPQNYTGYNPVYQPAVQPRDSQQRVMQQRRAQNDDGMFCTCLNHLLI